MPIQYKKRQATRQVILHASHTTPSQSNLKDFLAVKGRTMGLLEIGYHFLILRDGQLLSTRPHDTQGTHCPGYNRDSIGVCLGGGVNEDGEQADNFTVAQGNCLIGLMEYLHGIYGPLPLVGHTELPRYKNREWRCPPMNMEEVRSWLSGDTRT